MVKFKQQKPADITKTGLQNWRQLQQQNAMNQDTGNFLSS